MSVGGCGTSVMMRRMEETGGINFNTYNNEVTKIEPLRYSTEFLRTGCY
jgi:hypothetical protein